MFALTISGESERFKSRENTLIMCICIVHLVQYSNLFSITANIVVDAVKAHTNDSQNESHTIQSLAIIESMHCLIEHSYGVVIDCDFIII